MPASPPEIVVVGVSLGGLDAVRALIGGLPEHFPVPVAIAQHRYARSGADLLDILRAATPLPVVEPDDKEPLLPGHVYIAPPDYHLLLARGWCELSIDPPVCYARPSADVLFESAADAYGPATIAIVLTGANEDGANGAALIAARGGTILVQNPATARAPRMPHAALARVTTAEVLHLEDIAPRLVDLATR